MSAIEKVLIRITACFRSKSADVENAAPPRLVRDASQTDDGESGQELAEARERILSRLWAWRIEQCRRELTGRPTGSKLSVIPFPAVLKSRTQPQPSSNLCRSWIDPSQIEP